jgi:hypothetical protein
MDQQSPLMDPYKQQHLLLNKILLKKPRSHGNKMQSEQTAATPRNLSKVHPYHSNEIRSMKEEQHSFAFNGTETHSTRKRL